MVAGLGKSILDDTTWHIGYLEVKAGKWLLNRTVLIPTRWIESVSWDNCRVNLHHMRGSGLTADLAIQGMTPL